MDAPFHSLLVRAAMIVSQPGTAIEGRRMSANPAKKATEPFWKRKTLGEMTRAEWESLCDGCAKCCLVKLRDEDDPYEVRIEYTDVACRLLDPATCRCCDYKNRTRRVPECTVLTLDNLEDALEWLPSTCAYRLVHDGRDLEWWHPLVSGDPNTVHEAGISVLDRVWGEDEVDEEELEFHIVDWPR